MDATGAGGIRAGTGWTAGVVESTAGGGAVTDRGRGMGEGTEDSVGALRGSNVVECDAAALVGDGIVTAGGGAGCSAGACIVEER